MTAIQCSCRALLVIGCLLSVGLRAEAQQTFVDSIAALYDGATGAERVVLAHKIVETGRLFGNDTRLEWAEKGAREAEALNDTVSMIELRGWEGVSRCLEGDTTQGMALIRTACALDSSLKKPTGFGNYMLSKHLLGGAREEALALLRVSIRQTLEYGNLQAALLTIKGLMRAHHFGGQYDSVAVIGRLYLPYFGTHNRPDAQLAVMVTMADAFRLAGQTDSAEAYYANAIGLLDEANASEHPVAPVLQFALHENYGIILHSTARPLQAMEMKFKAIEIAESRIEVPRYAAYSSRINLALQCIEVADTAKGLEMLRSAVREELSPYSVRSAIYGAKYLFEHYEELGRPEKAERYLAISKKHLADHPGRRIHEQAMIASMEGGMLEMQGDVLGGIELRKQATHLLMRNGLAFHANWTFYQIAQRYLTIDMPDSALVYAQKAVAMSDQNNNFIRGATDNLVLAQALSKLGRYKEAYEAGERARIMEDSTGRAAQTQEMNYLRLQKEEAENAALAQQANASKAHAVAKEAEAAQANVRLGAALGGLTLLLALAVLVWINRQRQVRLKQAVADQRDALAAADEEKAVLLKEIHHRVKNNLQVVSSLLSMQSREVTDQAALDAVMEGQGRVKSIALIHQKLYQNENLSQVNFQEYTNQLVEAVAKTFEIDQHIEKSIDAEGVNLDIDTAIPIGLILNELVSNAYKYAFAGTAQGRLNVQLKRTNEGICELRVADSGSGLPDGFNPMDGQSLGMKIIDGLSRQLNGKVEWWNDNGAVFRVQFKEKVVG